MRTDPDQIRSQVAALLDELPDFGSAGPGGPADGDIPDGDFAAIARCLEQAHDVLVQALESVEKD